MALPRYDKNGARAGEVDVPAAFAAENPAVLHQAVVAARAGQRQGTSKTKTRGEVAGSGKKLWRQKGTGRARVGDRRPPNRVGGGTVTGPRPRDYDHRTPARMKREALRAALSRRVAAGEVIVVEAIALAEPKTRLFQELLETIGLSGDLLLVLPEYDEMLHRSGRNLRGLAITTAAEVTAYELLAPRTVILTSEAISRLEARLA